MNTLGERRFWTDLQEEKRNPGKEIEEKVSEEKLPEEAQNDTEEPKGVCHDLLRIMSYDNQSCAFQFFLSRLNSSRELKAVNSTQLNSQENVEVIWLKSDSSFNPVNSTQLNSQENVQVIQLNSDSSFNPVNSNQLNSKLHSDSK